MLGSDELVDAWLAGGLARKTVAVYLSALGRADRWLTARGHTLDDASATVVRELAESFPRTRSSRASLRSALRAYWAVSGRRDAPTAAVRVPSHPRMRCRALEDPLAARLAAAARGRRDHKGAAVVIGLYTGLRRAEIAAMRWGDIGPDGWLTVVGKGDHTRSLPLHPAVLAALGDLRAEVPPSSLAKAGPQRREFVFGGRFGGPVHPTTIWTWVRDVARDAELGDVATHVLRHTALATALDHTGDLRAVQELAGHARPETTAGYTRVRRNRLVAAVAAIEYEQAS